MLCIQRILLLSFMAVFVLTGCEKSSEPTEETKAVTEVAVQQKDEVIDVDGREVVIINHDRLNEICHKSR